MRIPQYSDFPAFKKKLQNSQYFYAIYFASEKSSSIFARRFTKAE